MNSKWKTVLVWGVLIVALVVFFQLAFSSEPTHYIEFATFQEDIRQGRVASVRVDENER